MKQIDTKGKQCPMPLILAKNGLRDAAVGEVVEILIDNDMACSNLRNYLAELGIEPEERMEEGVCVLRVTKSDAVSQEAAPAAYRASTRHDYVVAIKSDRMGSGDDDLGRILMRAFINSLKEADTLPTSVVLYNGGVRLAVNDTDTAASLLELENKGISIVICGTCVDFYGIKDRLAVGMIGNMFKITEILAEAGHVIYP